jgi:hypothetical protein
MALSRILEVGQEPPPLRTAEELDRGRRRQAGGVRADGRQKGRFAVINRFADFALAGLSRAEVCVWLLLWRDTKPDGLARTSQADLARRAGTNVRTMKRAVQRLTGLGLIRIVHRGGLRKGPSTYRVCVPPG